MQTLIGVEMPLIHFGQMDLLDQFIYFANSVETAWKYNHKGSISSKKLPARWRLKSAFHFQATNLQIAWNVPQSNLNLLPAAEFCVPM